MLILFQAKAEVVALIRKLQSTEISELTISELQGTLSYAILTSASCYCM